MPDELKSCPACDCNVLDVVTVGCWKTDMNSVYCCKCGMRGPVFLGISDAISAWNALPRAPRWVEYDGTESTLPPEGKFVLASLPEGGGYLIRGDRERKCWSIGDRWADLPEDK